MYAIHLGTPDDDNKVWLKLIEGDSDFSESKYTKLALDPNSVPKYNVMKGKEILDATGTSGGGKVIHQRIIDAIYDHGLTGLESHAVSIKMPKDNIILSDFNLVRSTQVCSAIDKSTARKVQSPINPRVMKKIGFSLDMTTVSTDFVRPDRTTMLLCNQKAKEVIESISPSISGIRFTPIEDYPL